MSVLTTFLNRYPQQYIAAEIFQGQTQHRCQGLGSLGMSRLAQNSFLRGTSSASEQLISMPTRHFFFPRGRMGSPEIIRLVVRTEIELQIHLASHDSE